jgi:L-lactate permease
VAGAGWTGGAAAQRPVVPEATPYAASYTVNWLSAARVRSSSVGTSATGLQGQEGDLLRLVFKWSIGLTVVMAVVVTLQAYVFPFVIP